MELQEVPEEEKGRADPDLPGKGLSEAQATSLADQLLADKTTALDTLVREELGIDSRELGGSAWARQGLPSCCSASGRSFPCLAMFRLGQGRTVRQPRLERSRIGGNRRWHLAVHGPRCDLLSPAATAHRPCRSGRHLWRRGPCRCRHDPVAPGGSSRSVRYSCWKSRLTGPQLESARHRVRATAPSIRIDDIAPRSRSSSRRKSSCRETRPPADR